MKTFTFEYPEWLPEGTQKALGRIAYEHAENALPSGFKSVTKEFEQSGWLFSVTRTRSGNVKCHVVRKL